MRLPITAVLGLASLLVALPAHGQDGTISMGFFVSVRIADMPAFEEASKKHVEWHREQGDPWTWATWSAVTGANGEYASISSGHTWADFDLGVDEAADAADWAETAAEYVQTQQIEMWENLPWGSRPADAAAGPPAMVQVFEFAVKPGQDEEFTHVLRKFTEAAESTNWAGRYTWTRVVSDGGPPQYFLVVPHDSWASFAPLEVTGIEVMTQAYGDAEARRLFDMFDAAAEQTASRIWAYRADLSYVPNL